MRDTINSIFNYLYSYLGSHYISLDNKICYNKYKNILELIPLKNYIIQKNSFENEDLIISIKNYCKKLNYNKLNYNKFIVSLSGGVDSMVLISILKSLGYDVIAGHINYNNREESKLEEEFIKEWCNYNSIKLYIKSIDNIKRENTKRTDYEIITKNIRFDFYKDIMNKELTDIILLAHHKDDIIENIVANICRGRYILDLAVIRENCNINDVNIGRPMLEYYKDIILKFAEKYNIPYFNDTTPDWSIRGKYRNKISPALEDAFTKNVKNNILLISNQADDWNKIIEKNIINPFMETVKYNIDDNNINIELNIEKYIDYPLVFWTNILNKIFNKFNIKAPTKKSTELFIKNLKFKNDFNYSLSNNCTCKLINSIMNITIKIK
mgnify:CR=1 FL=1